jgi:hypothetical protein
VTRDWNEHPAARDEFLAAHEHYLVIDDGRLGDHFADEVAAVADLIFAWPRAGAPYRGRLRQPQIRMKRLGRFPYSLVYVVSVDRIFVLAYAHESRRPGYWRGRLNDI